jgi:hypothetical protein
MALAFSVPIPVLVFFFLQMAGSPAVGTEPSQAISSWPGEPWEEAVDLTPLNSSLWRRNLSGIHWNSRTSRLWLANNSGTFTALKSDGTGGFVKERDYSVGGDLEAITQTDPAGDSVFLLDERENEIREYGIGEGRLKQTWNLTAYLGKLKNNGPEGLAFVPDAWLATRGFRDSAGQLYPRSAHGFSGLGGLFLVAVQAVGRPQAGYIYAVDLKQDGTWTAVGKYQTARLESCELAFDAESGLLFILHNHDGNTLEVTDLTSAPQGADRRFTTIREFRVPSGSNIEGFSIGAAGWPGGSKDETWCFFADDDNERGALRWFRKFSDVPGHPGIHSFKSSF